MRFVRDRNQDFLDIAFGSNLQEYIRFDDICVAMGWREIEQNFTRQQPVRLKDELLEFLRRKTLLEVAFSPEKLSKTRVLIQHAILKREKAFMEKLEKLADKSRE